MTNRTDVGVVVIGRNEGERLIFSLKSIITQVDSVVYVDSGSTDNSLDEARKLGVAVVGLDMSVPFTAARARNIGFKQLTKYNSDIAYVQFVDGDCEVASGWVNAALLTLECEMLIAVVCGRRKERYPDKSIYNKLCDIEWDTPIGEAKACGGDFMIRSSVFKEVEGFNSSLIAGEEPEMCVRIGQNGWKIWRIDKEMTFHDANIYEFKQWWIRNVRTGHAYAEGVFLHGKAPEYHNVVESLRVIFWGGCIPACVILFSFLHIYSLLFILIYPVQIIRMAFKLGTEKKNKWMYSYFVMLGKFPEFQGMVKFIFNKYNNLKSSIIEYK